MHLSLEFCGYVFNTYPQNSKFCIIDFLQEYRTRTDLVRENLEGNTQ